MAVKDLNSQNFDEAIANGKSLVDFYADWCNPCKMLAPAVEAASEKHTDVNFYRLNIDNAMDIARKFRVMSIPTIYIFKDGEPVNRIVGAVPKEKILEALNAAK